jgi:hypothetical protein
MNRPRRAGCGSAIARRRTPARPRELRCGGSRVRSPPASVSRWRSAGMGRLVALLLAGQQCAARRETRRWRAGRGPQPNHGVTNTARTDPGRREPLLWSQVVTDPQRQRPPPPATRDTSNHTHPQRMSAPTRWGGVRWSHPFSRWGGGVGLHTIELTVRAQAIKRTPLYFIQDKVAGFSRAHSPMALSW